MPVGYAGSARLQVRALNKTFGSVQVLTDVELTVLAGEVHGLAGQNGSGKSTLIKILTGLYTPDPGADYRVDGTPMRLPVRWPDVHAAGVSVVHQDLGLLDQLTVAENICVGGFPTAGVIGRSPRQPRGERGSALAAVHGEGAVGVVQPVGRAAEHHPGEHPPQHEQAADRSYQVGDEMDVGRMTRRALD